MAKRTDIECRTVDELSLEERGALRAQEFFVIQAQVTINRLMRDRGVSQAELARRLGVSEARVSSMFGNDKNFTLRTIGRILYALGEEAMLTTTREFEAGEEVAQIDTQSAWYSKELKPSEVLKSSKISLDTWEKPDFIYEEKLPTPSWPDRLD